MWFCSGLGELNLDSRQSACCCILHDGMCCSNGHKLFEMDSFVNAILQDDILSIIDEELERNYELETPWHEVLTEAVLYPSDAAAGAGSGAAHGAAEHATLLNADFASDDEDSDFECVYCLSVHITYNLRAPWQTRECSCDSR